MLLLPGVRDDSLVRGSLSGMVVVIVGDGVSDDKGLDDGVRMLCEESRVGGKGRNWLFETDFLRVCFRLPGDGCALIERPLPDIL